MKYAIGGVVTAVLGGLVAFGLTALGGGVFGMLGAIGVGYNGALLTYMWASR